MDSSPERRRWGALATILWAVFVVIVFLVLQGLIVIFYLAVTKPGLSSAELQGIAPELQHDGVLLWITTCASAMVLCPIILLIAQLKRGSDLGEYLGFVLPTKAQALWWFLAVAVFCLLSDLTSLLLGQPIIPEFMLKTYSSMKDPWPLWLALMVGAPLLEEMFFRGFLINGLADSWVRWQGAVIISSLAWALIHVQYDIYGITTVFVLGLVLGTARVKTGSTILTMVLHSLINLIATLQTVIRLQGSSSG